MSVYEGLFILRPDMEKEEVNKLVSSIEKRMKEGKGKILEKSEWGIRKLAYPIKKFEDGYYVIFNFENTPQHIEKFKTTFQKDERVLRKLIFRKK